MKKTTLIPVGIALMILLIFLGLGTNRSLGIVSAPPPPVFQGNLVLSGNNVTTIRGTFLINGSILVRENATLILEDAVVNLTQGKNNQFNITLKDPKGGNPRLSAKNSSVCGGNMYMSIHSLGNSSVALQRVTADPKKVSITARGNAVATVENLKAISLNAYDSSSIVVSDSTVGRLWGGDQSRLVCSNTTVTSYAFFWSSAHADISGSDLYVLQLKTKSVNLSFDRLPLGDIDQWSSLSQCSIVIPPGGAAPDVTLRDSSVGQWQFTFTGHSNATISGVSIRNLQLQDQSFGRVYNTTISYLSAYGDSVAWLENTTWIVLFARDNCELHLSWPLGTHATDSLGQDVPSAQVTVTYPDMVTKESRGTDAEGWARFVLPGSTIRGTTEYPVGDYSLLAQYGPFSGSATVKMNQSVEVEIPLQGLVISQYPLLLLSALAMLVIFTLRQPDHRCCQIL